MQPKTVPICLQVRNHIYGLTVAFLMSRLPVLAGAAGALGATYSSPYMSVDGAYQSRQSGQTSSSGASRLVVNLFPDFW